MKKLLILLTAVCLLLLCACEGTDSETHGSGEKPAGAPTEAASAEASQSAAVLPDPVKVELPEGFAPREHDHADSAVFGETSILLNITDPMNLVRREGGETESIAYGNILNEPFAGVAENGIYFCTGPELLGLDGELQPADSMFFYNVETGETTCIGKAINYGTLCGKYLVGARYQQDPDNKSAEKVTLIRHDLDDGSQSELLEIRLNDIHESGDTFYAKSFDGRYVYYTILKGLETTDFGIYRLDPLTAETQKVTDNGLPYGLDENGALLYGDYVHSAE